MCEDDIYVQFVKNFREKIQVIDNILSKEDELTNQDIVNLKQMFHSLKYTIYFQRVKPQTNLQ
jgi:hypothetical protein